MLWWGIFSCVAKLFVAYKQVGKDSSLKNMLCTKYGFGNICNKLMANFKIHKLNNLFYWNPPKNLFDDISNDFDGGYFEKYEKA